MNEIDFSQYLSRFRPPILFQRPATSSIHVEIPIDNPSTSHNSINGNLSATSEYFEHQSPTSSQTITTIASINRLNDNEFTLTSASRETVADVTSLIKQNCGAVEIEALGIGDADEVQSDDENVDICRNNLNCNSRSSSRCTTDTRSTRNINCNKDSVSITDHKLEAVKHCKNVVNISNMKELNKALIPLTHLSPSSRNGGGTSILNGVRCEMGVR